MKTILLILIITPVLNELFVDLYTFVSDLLALTCNVIRAHFTGTNFW